MLFYGRLVASNSMGEVWQEGDTLWLNLRDRGMTLVLTSAQLVQLMELLANAERTARTPERRGDEIRRLQISRARIADRIEKAKARGRDSGETATE